MNADEYEAEDAKLESQIRALQGERRKLREQALLAQAKPVRLIKAVVGGVALWVFLRWAMALITRTWFAP